MRHRKSKEANAGRMRHLANGIVECVCGHPYYTRYASPGRGAHLDAYYCPKCRRSIRRTVLDATLRYIVTDRLLETAVLKAFAAGAVMKAKQPRDCGYAKREAELAKLERGRKELVLSMAMGDINRAQFKEAADIVDRQIRDLKAMLPLPAPEADAKDYLEAIAHVFAEFALLPFAEQREILRRAVNAIVIDGRRSPCIPSLTLNGGFLGGFRRSRCGANSQLRSRSSTERCTGTTWARETGRRRSSRLRRGEIAAEHLSVEQIDFTAARIQMQLMVEASDRGEKERAHEWYDRFHAELAEDKRVHKQVQ